jgi:hypothetical protein
MKLMFSLQTQDNVPYLLKIVCHPRRPRASFRGVYIHLLSIPTEEVTVLVKRLEPILVSGQMDNAIHFATPQLQNTLFPVREERELLGTMTYNEERGTFVPTYGLLLNPVQGTQI